MKITLTHPAARRKLILKVDRSLYKCTKNLVSSGTVIWRKLHTHLNGIVFVQSFGSLEIVCSKTDSFPYTYFQSLRETDRLPFIFRAVWQTPHKCLIVERGEACWFEKHVGASSWGSSSCARVITFGKDWPSCLCPKPEGQHRKLYPESRTL